MSLQPHRPQLHVVPNTPLPLPSKPRKLPRVFLLTYDASKLPIRRTSHFDKHKQHEAWGTLYPNGCITLDTGAVFQGLYEVMHHFEQAGNYKIVWLEAGELQEEEER